MLSTSAGRIIRLCVYNVAINSLPPRPPLSPAKEDRCRPRAPRSLLSPVPVSQALPYRLPSLVAVMALAGPPSRHAPARAL